jgi:hypothetical protein
MVWGRRRGTENAVRARKLSPLQTKAYFERPLESESKWRECAAWLSWKHRLELIQIELSFSSPCIKKALLHDLGFRFRLHLVNKQDWQSSTSSILGVYE